MLAINHMMLLLMLTTTTINTFSVNTVVDKVDNDDEDSLETFEGVAERHNERMLCLTINSSLLLDRALNHRVGAIYCCLTSRIPNTGLTRSTS